MVDLEVLEDGTSILNVDVVTSQTVTYQNRYLKSRDKIGFAVALRAISKGSVLVAGESAEGKIVIRSTGNDDEDLLLVKLIG